LAFSLGLLMASEAGAQTGSLRGRIVDQNDEPIEKVEILIEFLGGVTRKVNAASNKKGDFVRVGLPPGNYKMTFTKEGYQSLEHEVRVRLGDPTEVGTVTLPKLPEGALSSQQQEQLSAELAKLFEEGVAAAQSGDYDAAIASFERVLELAPESPEANFNLGVANEKKGNVDVAVSLYRKAAELRPDYSDPYLGLANIYTSGKQWSEAMEVLERAFELLPTDTTVAFNLGAVAMNMDDAATAQAAFERILAVDPGHADAHYQLGMVFVNQANNEEAIVHLENYLELEPDGPNAATAQGILEYLKKN
jgi:Flp pilus assembly protein TadD